MIWDTLLHVAKMLGCLAGGYLFGLLLLQLYWMRTVGRIKFLFAWYDLWVGAYWDRANRRLYILPLPCLGVVIDFRRPE